MQEEEAKVLSIYIFKGTLSSGLKGGVKICKTPEEVANYTK